MCRIIGSPRANGSGSSIPFGLALSRKRPAPPNRTAIPKKPRWSGPKRNPSPARERNIESTTLPLTCTLARWRFRFAGLLSRVNAWPFRFITLLRVNASVFWQNGMEVRLSLIRTLARWGFRFARLLSRVNARPFRFITLLRVNASVFWQNGMEVRLSLITASRSTRAPTISPSTTPRTLTMCRIIGSPRANGSGSSIPFGLTLSRKRPAPPNRTAIPEKPRWSGPKRNPSPASDRNTESTALPLTCTRRGFIRSMHRQIEPCCTIP